MMKLVTHDGVFHADEVVATAVLTAVRNIHEITRTRDRAAIEAAEYVVDVGGEFDPEKDRFDHHQPSYTGGLASAGMVWLVYGAAFVREFHPDVRQSVAQDVAGLVGSRLIQSVDRWDTGDTNANRHFTLSNAISAMNAPDVYGERQFDAFLNAVLFAKTVLLAVVAAALAEVLDEQALDEEIAKATASGDGIVVLPRFLRGAAQKFNEVPTAMFIVWEANGEWRSQKVGATRFPASWGGLNGAALEEAAGAEGLTFCHKAGFILGARTKEAALTATEIAITKGEE